VSGARQRTIDALRRDPKRAEQLALMMTDRSSAVPIAACAIGAWLRLVGLFGKMLRAHAPTFSEELRPGSSFS